MDRGLHTLTYRWASNPALRTPSPPLAEVTGASSGLFLVCAPGEPFGHLAGPGAGLVVMAEEDGQIELTLRASVPGGSLAAEIELKRVEAPRPAFAPDAPAPRGALPEGGAEFVLAAHVSRRGDLQAARGDWICGPGAPGRIEGIEVRPLAGGLPVEYQVATGGRSGGWTGWFPAGSYAGSRGKAQPLIGLRMRVRPDAASGLALKADAAFLGAPTVTRAGREIELAGPCLLDPLVGLRLDLVPAASLPAEEAPATEAAPSPRAPGRLRVFRRGPPAPEAAGAGRAPPPPRGEGGAMAEIYTSSDTQALSALSPDAGDALARLLADLGLPSDTGLAPAPAPEETSHLSAGGDAASGAGAGAGAAIDPDPADPAGLTGLDPDPVASTAAATTEDAAPAADDGAVASPESGGHFLAAGGDTQPAGLGMDTLWGASAGTDQPAGVGTGGTEIHAAAGGGDSILSSAGFDTLHGGFSAIQASGDHATVYAFGDTIAATGGHALIDATASSAPIRVDAYGGDATVLGGAGDDTIGLHDVTSGRASVFGGEGNDLITGSPGGYGTYAGGAGDDHFLTFGLNDSVMGGDGSDLFSVAAFGTGHDTISGGAGDDAILFADRSFSDAVVSHHGATTLVSFGDGYSASLDGVEQLRFRDTILNG